MGRVDCAGDDRAGGCVSKPVERFTLEVDLPAEFRFIGGANYGPATGETCTLPRRRGKGPKENLCARYKPVAERVSFELPLTEIIEGCPTVLRSVDFRTYAKWGPDIQTSGRPGRFLNHRSLERRYTWDARFGRSGIA